MIEEEELAHISNYLTLSKTKNSKKNNPEQSSKKKLVYATILVILLMPLLALGAAAG